MKTLSRFFEYQRSIVAISLFLIGIATYLVIFHQKPAASNSSILAVERGTITEEVNVTGNTKPVFSAALAFERGGKILRVNVAVGNEVREGDLVASLDASDLAANFAEAEANIKIQEAKLAELRAGTRPEELALAETQTEKAKRALQNADENLRDKIVDAYTKSDDAIRNEADQFFSNPRSANPTLHISVPDASLKIALEANRIVIEQKLIASKISLQTLYARATDLT